MKFFRCYCPVICVLFLFFSHVLPVSADLDFGDGSSSTLTQKAWKAMQAKDYNAAIVFSERCISNFLEKALEQEALLDDFAPADEASSYWALNDVATCYFIKGKAHRAMHQKKKAVKAFQDIIDNLPHAQAWKADDKYFWKLSDSAKDQIFFTKKNVDFGDYQSSTLSEKAWISLNRKKYSKAHIYADKCIELYKETAKEQQSTLSDFADSEDAAKYWALNDVAACYFIKGRAYYKKGKKEAATEAFQTIQKHYSWGQCWNIKGYFWKIAPGAKDQRLLIENNIDFGHYKSFELAGKAWEALDDKKFDAVKLYANKCIKLYKKEALKQKASLNDFPPEKEINNYWALNDVATCYFIKGKALSETGHPGKAKKTFQIIIKYFPHAQCFDIRGWYWKVALAAEEEILVMESGLDFGDHTSSFITGQAWDALNEKDYKISVIYAKKCIELFEKTAREQQGTLRKFPVKDKAPEYWALNDVATCYFILGLAYTGEKKWSESKKAYKTVIKEFTYAQAWDTGGWYWKVAVGARKELSKIKTKK